MLAYCGSRISKHMAVMKNGALVCMGVPLARIGEQQYKGNELGLRTDDIVTVVRPPEEVFDPAALASFEAVPLTDRHPATFVNPSNWSWVARGHVQNVRRSPDGKAVLGDVIVNDESLIEKIKNGTRDISCGYETEYVPLRDGRYMQVRIRGNHVAVVEVGRATTTRIMDAGEKNMDWTGINKRLDQMIEMLEQAAAKKIASGTKTTLADECDAIVKSARNVEELTKSGCAPGEFERRLHQLSSAYDAYVQDADAGQAYAEAMRAEGLRQQEFYRPKERFEDVLRRYRGTPSRSKEASVNDAEDWAASINRAGAALRKK